MTNQTARVLELLKRFNNGKIVCIKSLQNDYLWDGRSLKTIQRDLAVIKEIFPNSYELVRGGENGCYKAVTKSFFDNFLDERTLSLVVQAFSISQHSNLFENLNIEDSDKRLLESKMREKEKIYAFKNRPLENKTDSNDLYKSLENAIYHKKKLDILYDDKIYEIKPYKILFMDENFYLASEVMNEKFIFTIFRISKIKDIKEKSETFHQNKEIIKFINDMQSPFAKYSKEYKKNLINVILEVDSKKARFFEAKKHLLSQNIESKNEDGSLTISYKVTQLKEIEPLIKKWIPHLKIIEPDELKNSLKKKIDQFYTTL